MSTTTDVNPLLDVLTRLVNERGHDWKYPNIDTCTECSAANPACQWHLGNCCRYFTADETPACIVGAVLHNYGYVAADAAPYEQDAAMVILENLDLGLTSNEIRTLSVMQAWQDQGKTWGYVLEYATRALLTQEEND